MKLLPLLFFLFEVQLSARRARYFRVGPDSGTYLTDIPHRWSPFPEVLA